MSCCTQLDLFPQAQADLIKSLELIRGSGVCHQHFVQFVSSLVTGFKADCNGATTIVACPDGALDQVLEEFTKGVTAFEKRTHRVVSDFSFLELRAPSSLSPTQMKVELLDRYRTSLHSARIGHRTQPRFFGDQFDRPSARTDVGQLVELLRFKRPPLVVLREAQNLALPGAPVALARANWRLVMDIASQSGIPHFICGNIDTVLEVLSDADFHSATDVFFLRPYNVSVKEQKPIFVGVLNDFDAALPWKDREESLARRIDAITKSVSGDADRLRRWILRALTEAVAEGSALLDWRHFEKTQPTSRQAEAAQNELARIYKDFPCAEVTTFEKPALPNVAKGKIPRLKPGFRKGSRDHVNIA